MRPDLVKFHHLGKNLKVFGNFSSVYLVFGITLSLLWQFCNTIEQIFIAVFWLNIEQIILQSGHTVNQICGSLRRRYQSRPVIGNDI